MGKKLKDLTAMLGEEDLPRSGLVQLFHIRTISLFIPFWDYIRNTSDIPILAEGQKFT